MEPRARAGKNVGKMNFGYGELRQLLYGGGDARDPLPETMRLLDEIATDFIQSLSFEAARIGQYSGRQKIKYEDFEFALRRNPLFLGKVREMFEMSKEVKDARKMPGIGEGNLAKADINDLAKLGDGEEGGEGNKNGEGPSGSGDVVSATTGTSGTGRGKKRGPYAKTAGKRKKAKMEEEAAAAAAAEAAAAAAAASNAEAGGVKVKEEPTDDATQATRGATADTADAAGDEEPDAEEPSNLDALFGDDDDDADADGDDDLGF
ncbi:hypothetical protein Sste5346_000019 [Sporothrix stenoceras]|uniref:Transcription initiation factor TFIID subunit 13 n=1 Tax=Sporothrix stenoceras TaxID=5173 RepID=A0ABR3ZRU2_9PEZI